MADYQTHDQLQLRVANLERFPDPLAESFADRTDASFGCLNHAWQRSQDFIAAQWPAIETIANARLEQGHPAGVEVR